jgi:TRAP-type C4-dicarboxylate transport system substrate-binding protein
LPPEVQKIILEVARDYETVAAHALNEGQNVALQALRNAGAHIRELPSEVRAEWANSLAEFPNAMAQDANSRGMPGSKIIRAYIEEIDRSGYNWPVKYVID